MARAPTFGLYQLQDRKSGKLFPTFYTRREVPKRLRAAVGKSVFVASTGERDRDKAVKIAESKWTEWAVQIAEAEKLGAGPIASLSSATAALETWRAGKCGAAAGFADEIADQRARLFRAVTMPQLAKAGVDALFGLPVAPAPAAEDTGPIQGASLTWARAYFASPRGAGQDRGTGLPNAAYVLLERLKAAITREKGWLDVPGFDQRFDEAVNEAGLSGQVTPATREALRQPFARAWREVVQHEETERRRAAGILAAYDLAELEPAAVEPPLSAAFEPRPGDKTVGEVIARFQASRPQDDTSKQYGHIFRCLIELLCADKLMRAVTDLDVEEIIALLQRIPANVTKQKRFADLSLREAADRADEIEGSEPKIEVKRLTHNSVRSYIVNLSAVFSYAKGKLRCIDHNPCEGLIPNKRNSVKREPLTGEELALVFDNLRGARSADSADFWVPAVLAWSGARANEISQLLVEDVKEEAGVPFLDLTLHDATGAMTRDKRLKNAGSARAVPLHPDLVAAGFLEFAARRRAQGERRLFPELEPKANKNFSHEVSRNFGRHLDRLAKLPGGERLGDPSKTLHGLRHGFRQAGRKVNLSNEILDNLGGWRSSGQGEGVGYGQDRDRAVVPDNAAHIAKIAYGGFTLGPPPAA